MRNPFKGLILSLALLLGGQALAQNVLVYTKTVGFDHNTREEVATLMGEIAAEEGFTVTFDDTGAAFNSMASLNQYDVIFFANTSGQHLNATQRVNCQAWGEAGGNFMSNHAASDAFAHSTNTTVEGNVSVTGEGLWDWYAENVTGASVRNNPNHTSANYSATFKMTSVNNTVNEYIEWPWQATEEVYYWEGGYINNSWTEVNGVESTGGNSYDAARMVTQVYDRPDGGRSFYTSMGHAESKYQEAKFKQLIKNGFRYVIAIWEVDQLPTRPELAGDPIGADPTLIKQAIRTSESAGNLMRQWTVNDATRVFYVEVGASGSGNSVGDPMSIDQAFSQAQATAGDWYWIKAGDYGEKNFNISNLDFDSDPNNPIAWVGYQTTPGDITGESYAGYDGSGDFDNIPADPFGTRPLANGFRTLDETKMPTIRGSQDVAPDYLDNGYAFYADGGESGYIFKNWQVEFMHTGWWVKQPEGYLWDNVTVSHCANLQNIEGQGGGGADLEGAGILFRTNNGAGERNEIRNSMIYNVSIQGISLNRSEYNYIFNTMSYSNLDVGNPQDYHFHVLGFYNRLTGNIAVRGVDYSIAPGHSGHGICFNNTNNSVNDPPLQTSRFNMADRNTIYGTSFHLDGSYAGYSYKDTIRDTGLGGGGYLLMDEPYHNMSLKSTFMGFGAQTSPKHPPAEHASGESAGKYNTFAFGTVRDQVAWSSNLWENPGRELQNIWIYGCDIDASIFIQVDIPWTAVWFQSNIIRNVVTLVTSEEGLSLNPNTTFQNNTWINSDNARNEAQANYNFIQNGNAPTITLTGPTSITLTVGDTYTPQGSTATDPEDGDITANIVVTGTVNTAAAGTYSEVHTVTDSDNNTDSVTRTIIVNTASNPGGGSNAAYVGNQFMFTPVMIDSILNRINNGWAEPRAGAYKDDVARLIADANAFQSNPDVNQWDNWSTSNGDINVSSAPIPVYGVDDEISFAAIYSFFLYQESANQADAISRGDQVMNKLLEYAQGPIQTTGLNARDTHTSPYMWVAVKFKKFIEAYTLVEGYSTMSQANKDIIVEWLDDWGAFFMDCLDFSMDVTLGSGWINEDYTTTGYNFNVGNSGSRTNPINGYTSTAAQQTALNNIRTDIAAFVHAYGLFRNNATAKTQSLAWFKAAIRFGYFADGTSAEMIRSTSGNIDLGLTYTGITVGSMARMALHELIATTNNVPGATGGGEYFDFVTSEGSADYANTSNWAGTSTSGGPKSLALIVKARMNYARQPGGQGWSPIRQLNGTTIGTAAKKYDHRSTGALMSLYYPNDTDYTDAQNHEASAGYRQDGLTDGDVGSGFDAELDGPWGANYGMIYLAGIPGAFSESSEGGTGGTGGGNTNLTNVQFSQSSLLVIRGNTTNADLVFTPSDATDKTGLITTTNNNVTATRDGDRIRIDANNSGTTLVTFTSNDGGYITSIPVTVIEPPAFNANFRLRVIQIYFWQ